MTLARKLAALADPATYGDIAPDIERIETHMSYVFLVDGLVYKLKKPVRHAMLDFRSLAARRRFCEAEVSLNQPLAPGIYLGAVPLVRRPDGSIAIGGDGRVVDWLVEMRRLDRARMLDSAISHRTCGERDYKRIAERLASFHRALRPVKIAPASYRHGLGEQIAANRAALADLHHRLPSDLVQRVSAGLLRFLRQNPRLFDRRAENGCIVEGHGDLRPEHVLLGPPVLIIDRLEFSRRLRTLDRADELAFLAMECERLGSSWFAAGLIEHYRRFASEDCPDALMQFYMALRACVRARLAVSHGKDRRKWRQRALDYLGLAERHLDVAGAWC